VVSIQQRPAEVEDRAIPAAAQRELRRTTEHVRTTSAPLLAIRVLRGVYDGLRPGAALTERASNLVRDLRNVGLPVPLELVGNMENALLRVGIARITETWSSWFPEAARRETAAYQLDTRWIEQADLDRLDLMLQEPEWYTPDDSGSLRRHVPSRRDMTSQLQ
jgi:hypothetical protein